MKKIYLLNVLIFLFISSSVIYSPLTAQEFKWVSNLSNNGNIGMRAMSSDTSGNFYITGNYSDDSCSLCLMLAKYDGDGNLLWLKSYEKGTGTHIEVSSAGNVIILGTITSDLTIEYTTLTLAGGADMFLASFNTDGDLNWAAQIGGPQIENPTGLAVGNDIYVSGTYVFNTKIGNDSLTAKWTLGTFIAKYSLNGSFSEVWQLDGYQARIYDQATTLSGGLVITGSFIDSLVVNNNGLKGIANGDIFIAQIDAGGSVEFIKMEGGNGMLSETGRAVATDANENIYLAAEFNGTVNFGNESFTSLGRSDIALIKYNQTGSILWAKHIRGLEMDVPSALLVRNEIVYITGTYGKALQIGDSVLADYQAPNDIFIGAYRTNGDFIWAQKAGSEYTESVFGISGTSSGDILINGRFGSSGPTTTKTAYFGSQTISTNRSNGDIYVARMTTTELDSGVGIKETYSSALTVYPNPLQAGSPYLTIDLPLQQNSRLSVYSTTGKLMHTAQLNHNETRTTVQLPNLTPGMYFLRLNSNKQVYHSKILVE